jgi:hypothetical protein
MENEGRVWRDACGTLKAQLDEGDELKGKSNASHKVFSQASLR